MSNTSTRFDVCVPRKYRDNSGAERTHFWAVGTGFGFERQTAEGTTRGVSVKLYSKLLVTDQLVLFEREPEQPSSSAPPPEDDIPF